MGSIFIRILVGVIGIPVGYYLLRYKDRVVMTVGKMEWAERYLGSGGTYNAWVLIGMAVIIGSGMYLFGVFPGQS